MAMIQSHISGRLRVRHAQFRLPERMTQVIEAVEKIPGVIQVVGNPRTGSVLIHYPSDDKTVAALLENQFSSMEENDLPPVVPSIVPSVAPSIVPAIRWRKWVKLGMMATYFGGAAAIVYNKKLHVGLQSLFIGFLAVHVWQNRWSLFD